MDDLAGLLGLVEIGAVELHPCAATADAFEHADTLIFDLDPGRGVEWDFVVDTAIAMRELLRSAGVVAEIDWRQGNSCYGAAQEDDTRRCTSVCQAARRQLGRNGGRRYVTSAALAPRPGKFFIDYLRNGRGTTAIGTYSPRVRPGFPIAVTWQSGIGPDVFTMGRLPKKRL